MFQVLRKLFGKNYQTLNRIEISSPSLLHNYNHLSSLQKGVSIAPVLKSNAYGHGLAYIAKVLDQVGAPFFCVDSLHEAYELLKTNVRTPTLVMGYVHPLNLSVKKLPFSYAAWSQEQVQAIARYQPGASIHVFVDTGMHREGVLIEELPALLEVIKKCGITLDGVMSHYAAADMDSNKKTQDQSKCFQDAVSIVKAHGFAPQWIHNAASTGILNWQKAGAAGNLARAGISLYGINPMKKDTNLKPVMRAISTVVQIKNLQKDESVGYDFTFTTKRPMRIAVLPFGYNDGLDRRLSNLGMVIINNTPCSILGKVSMNLTVIDVSNVSVAVGDEAIIYSDNLNDENSIDTVAKKIGAIQYEFLVHMNPNTRRILT